MRVAVCMTNMDARHALSRLVDDALLRRGVLPELSLFPMLPELLSATAEGKDGFDLIITEQGCGAALHTLCRDAAVILVGGREDGPDAFDAGARYFIEAPVSRKKLDRAIERCLDRKEKAL